MKNKQVTKEQFVALLKGAGVSEQQMQTLHRLFEKNHPEEHQAFLECLGIPEEKVREIRRQSAQ